MGLLFIRDPKISGCGKKTGRGVIWVEKRCSPKDLTETLVSFYKFQNTFYVRGHH